MWTEEGIFYIIWDWDSDKTPRDPTELYLVDPDHPEQQKKIYYGQENGFDLVSYHAEEHPVLLREEIYDGMRIHIKSHLLILNLNEGKIKQAIDLPGEEGTSGYIDSDQPTFYREFSEENKHTYVFDWSTKKLVDYGEYYPLTGWKNCFQGILGMKGERGNYTLKIVQAKDIWRKAGR